MQLRERVANLERDELITAEQLKRLASECESFQHERDEHYDTIFELRERVAELEGEKQIDIHSGKHLGAVRQWIKWNCPNGDRVTWGSDQSLGQITVFQLEELAQRIADAVEMEMKAGQS